MATAQIRSSITSRVASGDPVTGASRDDLLVGDVVSLTSVAVGSSYQWSLAYTPAGSSATFSGSPLAQSPGSFTVDEEGPYLVRLVFTDGTGTTEQFVRLRVLTGVGNLRLVSAGERVGPVSVPVDLTAAGWAEDQNWNLLSLLNLASASSGFVVEDEGNPLGNFTSLNFLGSGITAADAGGGVVNVTVPGTTITLEEEGVSLGGFGTLNFVGPLVTVAAAGGGEASITVLPPILQDEGIPLAGNPHTTLNFVGAGVVLANAGSGVATVTIAGGIQGLLVEDDGTPEGSFTTFNFIGTGVTAADSGGGVLDVTIAGGIQGLLAEDEGVVVTGGPFTTIDFVGPGAVATDGGGGTLTVTVAGGISGLEVEEDGVSEGSFQTLNFVGVGVTASDAGGGVVEVEVIGGIDAEDEGVAIGSGPYYVLDFIGAGVTATDGGGGTLTVTIPGSAGTIQIEDEGTPLGVFTTFNFIGAGLTASDAGSGVLEIEVPGPTAGDGLTLTGSTLDVALEAAGAGTGGLAFDAGEIRVNLDVTGGANLATVLHLSGNGLGFRVDDTTLEDDGNGATARLRIKDLGVDTGQLADGAATLPKVDVRFREESFDESDFSSAGGGEWEATLAAIPLTGTQADGYGACLRNGLADMTNSGSGTPASGFYSFRIFNDGGTGKVRVGFDPTGTGILFKARYLSAI